MVAPICMTASKFVRAFRLARPHRTCVVHVRVCRSHCTYRNTSDWYPRQTRTGSGISMAHCSRIRPISCILIWSSLYDACTGKPVRIPGILTRPRPFTETRRGRANQTRSRVYAYMYGPYPSTVPYAPADNVRTAFSGFGIIWLIGGVTCRKDPTGCCRSWVYAIVSNFECALPESTLMERILT